MAKSFATLIDEVEAELQDSANATWSAAELAIQLEKALREISEYPPYMMMQHRFEIESRTGTATSTGTGSQLVDSQGQFLPTDAGKVIYNTTDHTWATVKAYVDANTLTLTGDIMVSGESYEMYNADCQSNKQIYLGDVLDFIGINHGVAQADECATEYPLGTKRNVDVNGDVLTLLMDTNPEDSADADANVDVFVSFKKNHRVSQLTDLAGEIDLVAGYAAGVSTIHIDGLQLTGTFAEDTLFTIENCRGTYRVKADAAIAANECDVNIFPALEDAIVDNADVTIIGSTLDRRLERLVVAITAGKARMSKGGSYINENYGGGVPTTHIAFGQNQYDRAIQELKSNRPVAVRQTYSRL